MTRVSVTLESVTLESVTVESVTLESVTLAELSAPSESWVVRPAVTGALVQSRMTKALVRPGRLYRAGAWVRLGAGYHDEAWLWELSELMELMELCALRMLWVRRVACAIAWAPAVMRPGVPDAATSITGRSGGSEQNLRKFLQHGPPGAWCVLCAGTPGGHVWPGCRWGLRRWAVLRM